MPIYTYRREDGTTFDERQKFTDDPLTVCPTTGQPVVRVVQAASIIFKGSGFYVNDSRNTNKSTITNGANGKDSSSDKSDSSSESSTSAESTESTASKTSESAAKSETKAAAD